ELGENVTTGDVLRVLVKPGDNIAKDQAVLELETDKATIEVPSSVEGRVQAIKVKEGDKVTVGQAILSVEGGARAPQGQEHRTRTAGAPAQPKADAVAAGVAAQTPPEPAEVDEDARAPVGAPDSSGAERSRASGTAASRTPEKVVDINRGVRPAT